MTCDHCAGTMYGFPGDGETTVVRGRAMVLDIACKRFFGFNGRLPEFRKSSPVDLVQADHDEADRLAFEHDHRWGSSVGRAGDGTPTTDHSRGEQ